MSDATYVTIRNYHDPILAEIVINALHTAGIITFPLNENNSGLPSNMQPIEIKVKTIDVDLALEIIEDQENL
ncbi:MAG: DUF2007 domain-containing protein [Saprospiraceae bacterium]